ncbi:hypothetical protein AAIR98_001981 [Elusimicrobium simillimum]
MAQNKEGKKVYMLAQSYMPGRKRRFFLTHERKTKPVVRS